MIDAKMDYQAAVFVNASDIVPNADNIANLLDAFRDEELIPDSFQELAMPRMTPTARLGLASVSNEWAIRFASSRIDIVKSATDPKGSNLGDVDEFCSDVAEYFGRIIDRFPKRANRLALITAYLLDAMTPSALSDVYAKLLIPPPFYCDHPAFEWD